MTANINCIYEKHSYSNACLYRISSEIIIKVDNDLCAMSDMIASYMFCSTFTSSMAWNLQS